MLTCLHADTPTCNLKSCLGCITALSVRASVCCLYTLSHVYYLGITLHTLGCWLPRGYLLLCMRLSEPDGVSKHLAT